MENIVKMPVKNTGSYLREIFWYLVDIELGFEILRAINRMFIIVPRSALRIFQVLTRKNGSATAGQRNVRF